MHLSSGGGMCDRNTSPGSGDMQRATEPGSEGQHGPRLQSPLQDAQHQIDLVLLARESAEGPGYLQDVQLCVIPWSLRTKILSVEDRKYRHNTEAKN